MGLCRLSLRFVRQQFSFWLLRLRMNPQAVTENVLKHVDVAYSNLLQQVFYLSRRFQPVVKGENPFKMNENSVPL